MWIHKWFIRRSPQAEMRPAALIFNRTVEINLHFEFHERQFNF